jgi:ribosomal protein L24E
MTAGGEWVELPRQPYLTTVCHCDFCGKMVARRYLRQHHDGRSLRFCNGECAKLWHEYWLPRYGRPPEAEVLSGNN